jgi:negative regulator of flagellin synthesis FlgM
MVRSRWPIKEKSHVPVVSDDNSSDSEVLMEGPTMKIDNAGNVTGFYPSQGKVKKPDSDGDSDPFGSDSAPTENVAINPLASQISAASQTMGSEPAFDASKVESIKSAIASGQFQINPNNIADGLISSTKELLAS